MKRFMIAALLTMFTGSTYAQDMTWPDVSLEENGVSWFAHPQGGYGVRVSGTYWPPGGTIIDEQITFEVSGCPLDLASVNTACAFGQMSYQGGNTFPVNGPGQAPRAKGDWVLVEVTYYCEWLDEEDYFHWGEVTTPGICLQLGT